MQKDASWAEMVSHLTEEDKLLLRRVHLIRRRYNESDESAEQVATLIADKSPWFSKVFVKQELNPDGSWPNWLWKVAHKVTPKRLRLRG